MPHRDPDHTAADRGSTPVLSVRGLNKRYGGVVALDDVSFTVEQGEILGVIGPNGAGKSTLLKTISGETSPDQGAVSLNGTGLSGLSRHQVAHLGVAIAHQIPRPFGDLTVHDNVRVGAMTGSKGSSRRALEIVDRVLDEVGLAHKAHTRARTLTLIDRKRLELARALSLDPQLLLLDEVAAGLIDSEVESIIKMIEVIQARGVSMVVVEHVERVIGQLAGHVVVLDWGKVVAAGTPDAVAADPHVKSIYLGAGSANQVAAPQPESTNQRRPELLGVSDIHADWGGARALRGVDLTIAEGEVVALLGANGAGKSTFAQILAGDKAPRRGTIRFADYDVTAMAAHRRVRAGIAHAPEGRHVFSELTVRQNLTLGAYNRRARRGQAASLAYVEDLFPELHERRNQQAGTLSGGQQQMLAIARGLMSSPRLLVLDEVSLGLAPVMTDRVYESLARISASGVAILVIEQNVDRSLAIADRAYVLNRGLISFAGAPTELRDRALLHDAYFGEQPTKRPSGLLSAPHGGTP